MNPLMALSAALILLAAATNVTAESEKRWLPDAAYRTYGDNFKDIALLACLYEITESKSDREDLASSINGIREWTLYEQNEGMVKLEEAIDDARRAHYGSKEGTASLDAMKCMDFYHSDKLRELTDLYVGDAAKRSHAEDARR
jgi:hypothetical protein